MTPKVSIIILNHNHPQIINICLRTLTITEGVDYEVVVVDNGSDRHTVDALKQHKKEGRIDKLILETKNHMFSEGNNIGVRNSDPESEYILLLNSDVGFRRGDWLLKLLAWMEGTAEHTPAVWNLKPTVPEPGPKDIISCGWSHDASVLPSMARPEGWCLLIRRSVWQEMSPDFPWLYGIDEAVGKMMRAGAKCGVLWNYAKYLIHREGGSEARKVPEVVNKRTPDIAGWLGGLNIETLDFTLGPDEHDTYLDW